MIKDLMDLKMRMSVVFFVVLLTVALLQTRCEGAAEAKNILSASKQQQEDMELENQPKILNKPPFKTFHTRNGDIIDCIDIYRQPAFSNPLLKNHKIQTNPSFARKHAVVNSEAMPPFKSLKLGHESEECPQGTVPIRRTRKHDLININKYHSIKPKTVDFSPLIPLVRQYEVLETNDGDVHYGVKALINANNPLVAPDQWSSAQIWVQSGPPEDLNLIEAGWFVYPTFNEDAQTKLYASWSGIGKNNKNCINYLCSGFVQVDDRLPLGINFDHLSVNGGDIYALNIEIALDQQSGNWWLTFTENNTAIRIGYWPKELFNSLAKSATKVGFGAVTGAPANRPFPQMGDGNFPSTDLSKCGFIAKMQTIGIDGKENDIDPEKVTMAGQKPPCYDLSFRGFVDDFYRFTVAFGGPGGSCG